MDQGVLLNTISEQRNAALNQVAILQAQLATATKDKEALQAQCDALNAKLQEASKARGVSRETEPKKRAGRKPRAAAANGVHGTTAPQDEVVQE
jgi:chromosome segregation ATPase